MAQQPMYPAMPNSPVTELHQAINDTVMEIPILNEYALLAGPGLATIGDGENTELIRYDSIYRYPGNPITYLLGCERGYGGTMAQSWSAGQKIARYFTATDHEAFRQNIEDHEERIVAANEQLADMVINVKNFGAIGDGNSHPLSNYFLTLAEAQAKYAFVRSLTQEMDAVAIQAAINSISKGKVFFPKGTYLISGLYPLGYEADYPARMHDGIIMKSNIIYEGNNATIRASANCAYIFTTHLEKDINTDAEALQNFVIRGINFEKEVIPFADTRAFCHLICLESCINYLIENCKFKGWSGDAICIGTLAYADLSDWHKTIVRNGRIINCDFDGVDKSNRQGISIVCGEKIYIDKCNFAHISANGMPGAIDIEPDRHHEYANDIHISNCHFEDIGSGVGTIVAAVCFILQTPLDRPASNFSVKDCTFGDSFRAYQVLGLHDSSTEETLQTGSPSNFTFSGNTVKNCEWWFNIGGVDNVTIRNENVEGIRRPISIGSLDYNPEFLPVSRFYMMDNVIKNVIINDTYNSAPFQLNGTVLGGSISGNQFIDCGVRYTESTYELFKVFHTTLTKHKNLYIDNIYINTGNVPFLDQETVLFIVTNPLSYGSTILVKDDNIINIKTLKNPDADIHRYAKVTGTKGLVSDTGWFNDPNSYSESTLPDALPLGVSVSTDGTSMLITFKSAPRNVSRYNNMQIKFSFGESNQLLVRRPNVSDNTWFTWYTFTGV